MGSKWSNVPLGDLVSLQRGHDLPSQDRAADGKVPIMGSSGLTGYHDKVKCRGPGVVIGRSGNSMGVVSFCNEDYWPLNTALYVTDFKGNDPRYIYYLLSLIDFDQFNSGSAQKSLNRNAVYPYEVWTTTDNDEQEAIGKLLEDYEQKIELNRQINTTLESMAQALFKSWFVDFDPVIDNALAAGNPIPEALSARAERRRQLRQNPDKQAGPDEGTHRASTTDAASHNPHPPLPADIQQLFPSSFVFTEEMGWVPEGWAYEPVYGVAKFINGAAFKSVHFSNEGEGLPVVKIAELKNGVSGQTKFTDQSFDPKYRVSNGDILFSWSGNPDTSIDTFIWQRGDGWLNQHIFKVSLHKENDYAYVYSLLKNLKPVFAEIARDKQTTGLGHVTAGDMKRLNVVSAPTEVKSAFNKIASSLIERRNSAFYEVNTLVNLRDSLLPKLLSGQLQIPEAEKQLAEVI